MPLYLWQGFVLVTHSVGIQHHTFESEEDFFTWKEQEEAQTHTFYILHDKPYVMSASEDQGIEHLAMCLILNSK